MRKCPCCNSTRITEQVIDDKYVISCSRCGFTNKRDLSSLENSRD